MLLSYASSLQTVKIIRIATSQVCYSIALALPASVVMFTSAFPASNADAASAWPAQAATCKEAAPVEVLRRFQLSGGEAVGYW